MVQRPDNLSQFEFAVLAGLRASQLNRGCTPRVEASNKIAVTALMEIAQRKIVRVANAIGVPAIVAADLVAVGAIE